MNINNEINIYNEKRQQLHNTIMRFRKTNQDVLHTTYCYDYLNSLYKEMWIIQYKLNCLNTNILSNM